MLSLKKHNFGGTQGLDALDFCVLLYSLARYNFLGTNQQKKGKMFSTIVVQNFTDLTIDCYYSSNFVNSEIETI